jgi:GT2 family glycosyltransferase
MSSIAVVILNWNGLGFLQKFLPGVVGNTAVEGCTIWLADNGSTDGSTEWVADNLKSVQIISLGENHGYAGGYVKALEMINADYYLLLNSDIEVTAGWLEPLAKYMDENVKVAACQPKILAYNRKSHFEYAGAAGGFIDKYGYPFCRGRILNYIEEDKGQYDTSIPVFWASGACMMVRKTAYREAGGLDVRFFAHMEEIDRCWRFHNLGYTVSAVPQSVVYHVGGGTLKYDTPGKSYLNFRNNLFMLYKNLPPKSFRTTLFIRKILDGVAGVVFLFSGKPRHFTSVVRAHYEYYRAGKWLKAEREKNMELASDKSSFSSLSLNKSILFLFYFKRIRRFSDIDF